jgi:hypothetical protein
MCWSAIIVVPCGCFRDISRVAASGVGCVVCCYLVCVSCNVLNIGLCVSVFVSWNAMWSGRSSQTFRRNILQFIFRL